MRLSSKYNKNTVWIKLPILWRENRDCDTLACEKCVILKKEWNTSYKATKTTLQLWRGTYKNHHQTIFFEPEMLKL